MNRNLLRILSAGAVALLLCAASARAAIVIVEVQGEVWGNLINDGTLGEVEVGEDALLTFAVDSDDFVDNPNFPTRGYAIDLESFQLAFSGGASIGLTPTFTGPAYFVIRENDPAVDGFFLSQGLDNESTLPLDQAANVDEFFGMRYTVTYEGDTLDSLDILDALGTYEFTGLMVFGMSVDDGPFTDIIGMDFVSMTLSVVQTVELTFDPPSLDFGDTPVGTTSAPEVATLHNTGDVDLTGLIFSDLSGSGFDADTSACGDNLPAGESCDVSVTFTPTEAGPVMANLEITSAEEASGSLPLIGAGVGAPAFTPAALTVDPSERVSDGNGIIEPNEQVEVAPAWRNDGDVGASLTGTAADFTGPDGADYELVEAAADYGLIESGETARCDEATEVCYGVSVNDPAVRPATHWEATFEETLDDADDTAKTWSLHIGDSFPDVPRSSLFYTAIETLLHSGVTGGCGDGSAYCPSGANSRSQMPVFMLRSLMGPDYTPPACVEDNEMFDDVPFDSAFCPWIQDLADRGIVSGCGDDSYCPSDPVSRAQMAIFILRTLNGADYEPPACTHQFTDVPCPSLFADWIEDLAARGITDGCTANEYCPGNPVSRAQMAIFITKAFEFTLYGP